MGMLNSKRRVVGRGTKPTFIIMNGGFRYRSTHPTIYPSYARFFGLLSKPIQIFFGIGQDINFISH